MKKNIFLFSFLFSLQIGFAQELYNTVYGNPKDTPILFLHGGPGYNSAGFEITTAQLLSEKGFYVLVYDRRGEGRSSANQAKFTFEETFQDIISLLKQHGIEKVNLIGHSFGGIVGTLFAEKYPKKVNSLILVGAPVSLQETFKTILSSSRKIYTEKNDSTNLNYIDMIEKMDPTSAEYYAYSFGHAMQNGFYSPKNPSNESKAIYNNALKNQSFSYASKMTIEAPQGFLKNEKYTSIDLTQSLQRLVANETKIYGLYGKEDGLYSQQQIASLAKLIGNQNVNYMDNCSHNVFIDQQELFLTFLKTNLK